MAERVYRVIVAEDELPIREHILNLVREDPKIEIAGVAGNGADLKRLLKKNIADIALLDIDLPVKNTMEVLSEVDSLPGIVFITAYENFAVKAFEIGAVDFLIKPFQNERLFTALNRAKDYIDHALAADTINYNEVVWIREEKKVFPVSVDDIIYLQSDDKYTKIHTLKREYRILRPLSRVYKYMNQYDFTRIHRCFVIKKSALKSIEFSDQRYMAVMTDKDLKLPVSKTYLANIKNKIV
ncbi:MAG: LytTR family DNA-binding domain-containing protein [Spirochaetia bacterium]|nr:LytTR family DNA-binding domain-containing protein [Spirochaetia bacterium]